MLHSLLIFYVNVPIFIYLCKPISVTWSISLLFDLHVPTLTSKGISMFTDTAVKGS